MKIKRIGKSMFSFKLEKKPKVKVITLTHHTKLCQRIFKNIGTCKSVYRQPKKCVYCNENLEYPYEICRLCGKHQKRSRTIPKEVQREVWRRDQGRCVDCQSRVRLEYDHIIPFSQGGSNTVRNIELRCEKCNRKKSNKI